MNTGFLFEGKSADAVLKKAWDSIKKNGSEYKSQRGLSRSIKAATFIITEPQDDRKSYPYWSKSEDDWYQDNFVKKESNKPPEYLKHKQDIYGYKYAWRSRYYDSGWGYLKGVISLLQYLKLKRVNFSKKSDLIDLIKQTYKLYHPEIILAVLSWKGEKLINFYLKNPEILDLELKSQREDTLLSIVEELRYSPTSRRAIIPSFIYQNIDHSGSAGAVPVYQNDQLDINHDREWGMIASQRLRLPLQKIVIYANDVWANSDKDQKHLSQKTDIKSWLFAVTDAYDPETLDIDARISSDNFQKKLEHTLKKFK